MRLTKYDLAIHFQPTEIVIVMSALNDLRFHFQPAEVVIVMSALNDLRFHLQAAEVVVHSRAFGFGDLGFHFGCSFGIVL